RHAQRALQESSGRRRARCACRRLQERALSAAPPCAVPRRRSMTGATMTSRISPPAAAAALLAALLGVAAEPSPTTWVKLDRATIEGRRHDVPLGYSPDLKRFLILGGRTGFDEYKKPRSYDELALDMQEGRWENWLPPGKDWGPRFGPCRAPAWK